MTAAAGARRNRRFVLEVAIAAIVAVVWSAILTTKFGGKPGGDTAQTVSNFGLTFVALAAGLACFGRSRREPRIRRFWILLGCSALSWGLGQTAWTWYESVRGVEVPFPGWSDIGYLGAVPFAAAAMLALPSNASSVAGRVRTLLDGLMIAGSFLLISWVIVLDRVFAAGADSLLSQTISLAYPIGDVMVVTIVVYVMLRAREQGLSLPFPLWLIGPGLLGLAVADSGFAYLTAVGGYASGNFIDIGWFAGYLLILLAARTPISATAIAEDLVDRKPLGVLLPYGAVVLALLTSVGELLRSGKVDAFVSWNRTFIIVMLVVRQMLTLLENLSLTQSLEDRVVQLRASEQWFEALVQQSSDVVTVTDPEGVVRYQSESLKRMFGYDLDEVVGHNLMDLIYEPDVDTIRGALREAAASAHSMPVVEIRMATATGDHRHVEVTITNLLDNPNVQGLVLNMRDISERRVLEDQLVHQAFHDSLTELANRALFQHRVDNALGRSGAGRGTVLFLDLDGFKEINDSLGHASGDLLLTQVAWRLQACVRAHDTVARLGGDEFAVLLEGDEAEVDAHALAARITNAFQEPFTVEGREIRVRASIGMAVADHTVETGDQLLRNADLAMYRAKASGGGTVQRYDPSMHSHLLHRLVLEDELRQALGTGQFSLYYQPWVNLLSGQPTGLEALIRWHHPTRGLITPDDFIPVAEETGLIRPIGRWVLFEACRQGMAWTRAFPDRPPLAMSVNISARQFSDDDLVDDVANALSETGLPPSALVLEVTESVLVEHTEDNLVQLQELKRLGVQLAIDDFGTGYSSLAYLHRFPVDALKIDRSFIERLDAPGADAELVKTVIQLGDGLGLRTVAEGIEKASQAEALVALGCIHGQGYYYSVPLPAVQMTELLTHGLRSTFTDV